MMMATPDWVQAQACSPPRKYHLPRCVRRRLFFPLSTKNYAAEETYQWYSNVFPVSRRGMSHIHSIASAFSGAWLGHRADASFFLLFQIMLDHISLFQIILECFGLSVIFAGNEFLIGDFHYFFVWKFVFFCFLFFCSFFVSFFGAISLFLAMPVICHCLALLWLRSTVEPLWLCRVARAQGHVNWHVRPLRHSSYCGVMV